MAELFLTETGGSQPPAPATSSIWFSMLQHAVDFKAETPVADYDVVKQVISLVNIVCNSYIRIINRFF